MSVKVGEYFSFDLTRDDLRLAEQNSETKNPLALAFVRAYNEAGYPGWPVTDDIRLDNVEVFEGCLGFARQNVLDDDDGDDNTVYNITFALNPQVYVYLIAFDKNRDAVKPISVYCEFTDIERDEHNNELSVQGVIDMHDERIGNFVDGTMIYDILMNVEYRDDLLIAR